MKRTGWFERLGTLKRPGLAGWGWIGLLPAVLGAPRDVEEGQAMAAELRSARPAEAVEVRGLVKRRDADGRRTAVPFRYELRVLDARWEAVYETPGDGKVAAQRLVVVFREDAPPLYLLDWIGRTNGLGNPEQLRGDAAMVPFAGSDFWLADLGLDFLHWPEQRLVTETTLRMRKGRPCRVLESRRPGAGSRGYTRVRSWIDRETGKPIIAEAYGPGGKLLKEFEIGGVTKVNGAWELKNLEMRNVVEDTMTVLEFRYEQRE
jgi:hypothetical protein